MNLFTRQLGLAEWKPVYLDKILSHLVFRLICQLKSFHRTRTSVTNPVWPLPTDHQFAISPHVLLTSSRIRASPRTSCKDAIHSLITNCLEMSIFGINHTILDTFHISQSQVVHPHTIYFSTQWTRTGTKQIEDYYSYRFVKLTRCPSCLQYFVIA